MTLSQLQKITLNKVNNYMNRKFYIIIFITTILTGCTEEETFNILNSYKNDKLKILPSLLYNGDEEELHDYLYKSNSELLTLASRMNLDITTG